MDCVKHSYNTLKNDAKGLLELINKYVKVKLIKETEFCGFVHSIDPIQHSIILIIPEEDSYTVTVIPGHAILNVFVTKPVSNYKAPQSTLAADISSDTIIQKKDKLIAWFKRNLLSTTESEDKILFGNVSILPPYGVSNICTDNPVVAMQVRKIIENMPQDLIPDE